MAYETSHCLIIQLIHTAGGKRSAAGGHSTVAEEKKKFLDAHDDGKFGRISGRAGGLR